MSVDTIDLERRVIGSVIRDPSLYEKADIIRYDDLEDRVAKDAWSAIKSLMIDRTPVTVEAVMGSCLDASGPEIRALSDAGTLNVDRLDDAIKTIIDKRRNAALIRDLGEQLGRMKDGQNWRETIGDLSTKLVTNYDGLRSRSGSDVRNTMIQQLRRKSQSRLPTGIKAIDDHFGGGLINGFMVGLGAQTKTGKTTLVSTFSGNWDERKIPHLVFSLERRDTHIETMKTARRLKMNMDALADHIDAVENEVSQSSTHYIHDTSLTVEDWRHEVLYHVRKHGVRAVLVDYFQLFMGSPKQRRGETRENELSRVVQIIANTAVDADIPVVLMSQNNEQGEPKDCKAIKQAAGYYGVIHRDQGVDATYIQTLATSISSFTDIGGQTMPAMYHEPTIGPHFRNP